MGAIDDSKCTTPAEAAILAKYSAMGQTRAMATGAVGGLAGLGLWRASPIQSKRVGVVLGGTLSYVVVLDNTSGMGAFVGAVSGQRSIVAHMHTDFICLPDDESPQARAVRARLGFENPRMHAAVVQRMAQIERDAGVQLMADFPAQLKTRQMEMGTFGAVVGLGAWQLLHPTSKIVGLVLISSGMAVGTILAKRIQREEAIASAFRLPASTKSGQLARAKLKKQAANSKEASPSRLLELFLAIYTRGDRKATEEEEAASRG
ncbi:Aste57867_10349 [Aphanomyces stellatus]|uniref:Aste57867_10349 protein n=1 Tax=Aphanomyces stellatus TaxID=120398 RepID=A0A485KR48_9STRA|nr:hypothetical protein As57867_010309 [Aphanomyces stellatus]VFT87223.1 Aste57867_10349 [Aphanomyces stellatus]